MRTAALLAFALLAAPAAHAQTFFHSKWMGNISCGSWPRNEPIGTDNKSLRLNFILGFLSGRASATGIDIMADTDIESISAWLDNYCAANPLASLMEAAKPLEKELIARLPKPQ